jgi:hypothetical protein
MASMDRATLRNGHTRYFSATDRAPKPGEYKFMTQGMLQVGELSVTFTILTNEGQELVIKQALDALKGAAQRENWGQNYFPILHVSTLASNFSSSGGAEACRYDVSPTITEWSRSKE